MTNRTALIWILGGLAAMLAIGRRKGNAPAVRGICGTDKTGREAVKYLLKMKGGECPAAFHRNDVGDIDLIWGEVTDPVKHKGYGLAHIIDKHGTEFHYGNSRIRIEDFLPIVIMNGRKYYETPYKAKFKGEGYKFVIAKKSPGRTDDKIWLLTAFELEE